MSGIHTHLQSRPACLGFIAFLNGAQNPLNRSAVRRVGAEDSAHCACEKRKPFVVVIQDDVVIGTEELVLSWIQRHNLDLWIVSPSVNQPSLFVLFGRLVIDNKSVSSTSGCEAI